MAHKIPRWALRAAARDTYLDRSPIAADLDLEYDREVEKIEAAGYTIRRKPEYTGNNRFLQKWARFTTVIPAGALVGADDIVAFGRSWDDRTRMSQVATLRHERVHTAQIAGDGAWLFATRYAVSHNWRWIYEVQAYRMSIAILAMAGASQATQETQAGRIARSLREAYSLRRLRADDVITQTERLLLTEVK